MNKFKFISLSLVTSIFFIFMPLSKVYAYSTLVPASLLKVSGFAAGIVNFPSCESVLPRPGNIAHYTDGEHQIVGGSLLMGSDDVYSKKDINYLQCFCPAVGNQGIQTNWLRANQPINGWYFVNGTQWGLGNFNYAAKNISFTCQSTLSSSTR